MRRAARYCSAPHTQELDTPKAILFTNKDKTSPMYKGLSMHFIGRLKLGEVRASEAQDLFDRYGIEASSSTLLVLKDKEAEPVKYEGESMGWTPVVEFLEAHALSEEYVQEYYEKKHEEQEKVALIPRPPHMSSRPLMVAIS